MKGQILKTKENEESCSQRILEIHIFNVSDERKRRVQLKGHMVAVAQFQGIAQRDSPGLHFHQFPGPDFRATATSTVNPESK